MASFLQQGYHGTGLKEVLDRVGVPKGSFYNYFASKEEFGAAAIRHYGRCLGEKMAGCLAKAPDALTGLRQFFELLMRDFEQAGYTGGCLVANLGGELEGSDVCRTALAESLHAWRDGVRDALARAQKEGTVRQDISSLELAETLIDSWEGAVIRMKIERSLQPLQHSLERLLEGYFRP